MKTQRTLRLSAVVLVIALGLAACGGGGDGGGGFFPIATTPPPTTTNPPPPAATDPFDAFVAYVKGLVNQLLDTAEPADVTAFDPPPRSETREPIAAQ